MERIDWSNREEVKLLLKRSGFDIRWAPEEIKSDPEMVLIAATQNPTALQYVSEEFSRDPVFMTKLVAENGRALQEFKPKKNMPKEMALIAVKNHRLAMQAIPEQFKNDPDIIMAGLEVVVEHVKDMINVISYYKTRGKDVLLDHIAAEIDMALRDATRLRENKNYKGEITEKYMDVIKQYKPDALESKKFMLHAIEYYGSSAIEYASDKLLNDQAFILEAIAKNSKVKNTNMVKELLNNNPELAKRVELYELQQKAKAIEGRIKEIEEELSLEGPSKE